jgi:hypothetical protein
MWSFLVLGIIPGTNIQINFKLWLLALALSTLLLILVRAVMRDLRKNRSLPPSLSQENS